MRPAAGWLKYINIPAAGRLGDKRIMAVRYP
jgi:hypothetical protein